VCPETGNRHEALQDRRAAEGRKEDGVIQPASSQLLVEAWNGRGRDFDVLLRDRFPSFSDRAILRRKTMRKLQTACLEALLGVQES